MNRVDVLIIAAVKLEYEAAKAHLLDWSAPDFRDKHPHGRGSYQRRSGGRLSMSSRAQSTKQISRRQGNCSASTASGI